MSYEPRQSPPSSPDVVFEPPGGEQPRVELTLADILTHLGTNARQQRSVPAAARQEEGLTQEQIDEANRRLDEVGRLTAELREQLAALDALRPGNGGPVIT